MILRYQNTVDKNEEYLINVVNLIGALTLSRNFCELIKNKLTKSKCLNLVKPSTQPIVNSYIYIHKHKYGAEIKHARSCYS